MISPINQYDQQHSKRRTPVFGVFSTVCLCAGLIAMYAALQLVGVYVFTPLVLGHDKSNASAALAAGSLNGTVISYSMLLTMVGLLSSIWLIVGRQLSRRGLGQSHHRRITTRRYLALNPISLPMLFGGIGLWLVFAIVSELLTHHLAKDPTAFMMGLLSSAEPRWLLVAVVVLAVPLYEEFVFRGVLWSAINEQVSGKGGVWLATLATSVLFAMLHTQYAAYEMATIFVLSMLFGLLRHRSNSLWLPVIIHMLNNGVAMLGVV